MSLITVTPVRGVRRGRVVTTQYMGQAGDNLTVYSPTAAAAKQAAMDTANVALRGTYTPALLKLGRHTALVWREPNGWHYRLDFDGYTAATDEAPIYGCSSAEPDRETIIRRTRYHLAQMAYDPNHDARSTNAMSPHVTELRDYVDPADRHELLNWVGFQRAYQHYRLMAQAGNATSNAAHAYACDNATRFTPRTEDNA